MEQRKQLHFEQNTKLEVRELGENGKQITGYASVFNQVTDLGVFKERVAPGAFLRSLKQRPDIRALWDHDSAHPIGRVSAGTLNLREDGKGLFVEITPPSTQMGKDAVELVRTGHVTGMSFGFMPAPGGEKWEVVEGEEVRTLKDIDLFEISVVTFPAYDGTSAESRSLLVPEQYLEPEEVAEQRRLDLKSIADMRIQRGLDGLKKRLAWLERL